MRAHCLCKYDRFVSFKTSSDDYLPSRTHAAHSKKWRRRAPRYTPLAPRQPRVSLETLHSFAAEPTSERNSRCRLHVLARRVPHSCRGAESKNSRFTRIVVSDLLVNVTAGQDTSGAMVMRTIYAAIRQARAAAARMTCLRSVVVCACPAPLPDRRPNGPRIDDDHVCLSIGATAERMCRGVSAQFSPLRLALRIRPSRCLGRLCECCATPMT